MFAKAFVLAVASTGAASAQPEIIAGKTIDSYTGNSPLSVQAHFRPDTNKWDTRLSVMGTEQSMEITGAVANGRPSFEYQSFGFELTFTPEAQKYVMVVTSKKWKPSVIELTDVQVGGINSIRIDASGSQGAIGLTQFYFQSENHSWAKIPDLSADIGAPTSDSVLLHFGEHADLTDGSWALSGTVTFGAFDRKDPGDGVNMTVTMSGASAVPGPGAMGLFALASMVGFQRIRR